MIIEENISHIDGLKIHYQTAGDPKRQPLVFVHGWGVHVSGPLGLDSVIAALAEHFYVVAPEMPGFMRSEPPKEVWGKIDFAHFLSKILAPLALHNPIIMGQSFGGGVVTEYAKYYPENIKALILVDAVLRDRRENWYLKLRHLVSPVSRAFARSRLIPPIMKRLLLFTVQGVPSHMARNVSLGDYEVMTSIAGSPKYNVTVDYTKLPMPLILVWGDRDTFVTPIQRAREIHAEVSGSKLIIVPGPHTILYKKPRMVVERIMSELNLTRPLNG